MSIKKIIKQNNIPLLQNILLQLRAKKIAVGLFNDEPYVLMYGTVNEYGMDINITDKMRAWLLANGLYVKSTTTAIHIPERSFIRKTFMEKGDQINSAVKINLDQLLTMKIDINTFFNRTGDFLVQIVQQTIENTFAPPNHPFTVQMKGSNHPLIDSGKLFDSITYKIV